MSMMMRARVAGKTIIRWVRFESRCHCSAWPAVRTGGNSGRDVEVDTDQAYGYANGLTHGLTPARNKDYDTPPESARYRPRWLRIGGVFGSPE